MADTDTELTEVDETEEAVFAANRQVQNLKDLEEKIAKYEELIGLKAPKKAAGIITEYLELSGDDLLSLDWEELSAIVINTTSSLVYIQRELNKHKARVNWCESTIHTLGIQYASQYEGYTQNDRYNNAIADLDVAVRLSNIKKKEQALVDSTAYIVQRLDAWLESVNDLKISKRRLAFANVEK